MTFFQQCQARAERSEASSASPGSRSTFRLVFFLYSYTHRQYIYGLYVTLGPNYALIEFLYDMRGPQFSETATFEDCFAVAVCPELDSPGPDWKERVL